jgi:hypothetical protein
MDRLALHRCARRAWALLFWTLLACLAMGCATSAPGERRWSIVRLRDGRGLMVRDVERGATMVTGRDGHDRAVEFSTENTVRIDPMPVPAAGAAQAEAPRVDRGAGVRFAAVVPLAMLAGTGVGVATSALFLPLPPLAIAMPLVIVPPVSAAIISAIGFDLGGRGTLLATTLALYGGFLLQGLVVVGGIAATPVAGDIAAPIRTAAIVAAATAPLPYVFGWLGYEASGRQRSTAQRAALGLPLCAHTGGVTHCSWGARF